MTNAFEKKDYQTAHLLNIVQPNKALNSIKKPKRAAEELKKVKENYGSPSYEKTRKANVYLFTMIIWTDS